MDRVARRGPLARAPGALTSHNAQKLKGGTLWGFSTSILSQNMKKSKKFFLFSGKNLTMPKNWKGGPFEVFQHPFCRKTWKNRRIFFYFREKISQCQKNWKGGPFGIFQHPFCRKTSKKYSGDPLGKFFFRKVSQCRKKIERGDSLVSPGMVCYADKQVKPFWSSSLGQMVHFDTIIFCRTFKNYFGQFVWIEKKSL